MSRSVGIIGCGVISGTHLSAWQNTSAFVRGVFDLDLQLAEKRAKDHKLEKIYDDMSHLIDECDIVDVCTPPHTHADIATRVMEAGRHLLIEKPLVTSLAEWDQLSRAIASSRGKIAVVHNLKFISSVQRAKRRIDEGRIGKVIGVSRQFLTNPATDRMLNARGHWSHNLPGGRWFETLPHELYLTHHLAGPMELSAVSTVQTNQRPQGVSADEVLITMKGAQSLGTIHYSANCGLNKRMLFVYGSQGMITIDLLSDALYLSTVTDSRWKRAVGRMFVESSQIMGRMIPDRAAYAYRHLTGRTPHANIIEAFVAYLDGLGPSPTPMEEIDYVVRYCDKIGRAIDYQAEQSVLSKVTAN